MRPPRQAEDLHAILSQGRWERAVAILARLDPAIAADVFLDLSHQDQEAFFRRLPPELAASLIPAFPYFDAFILLHTLPLAEMRAVFGKMNPLARASFLDDLPEENWRQITGELSAVGFDFGREAEPVGVAPVSQPIIEARQVEKKFARPGGSQIQVIAPTTLSVQAGTIVALPGPSGSGKSTFLRMLAGLTPASAGEVLWHGCALNGSTPNAAIVFQSFALFPWLTVRENVEAPLVAQGMAEAERERRSLNALNAVGLSGFGSALPKELSGGMKQRVGFARALAVEPEVLFMDEPFSALDVLTAENLRGELLELWRARTIPTKSIFLVTHNIDEAVLLADRIIVMGRHPAKIRADFLVPLEHPRERKSAEFLLYVDYIYKLMTQPELEAGPPMFGAQTRKTYSVLPHAGGVAIIGLLELMLDRDGVEDLHRVAKELQTEIDDLLPIIEACVLLGFAKSQRGDIELTRDGRTFAEAETPARKALFRKAALANATLLRQIVKGLQNKSDRSMPLEFFRDLLEERFSDQDVERQIDTALNWGRYADIFTYESASDRLRLSQAMNGVAACV